MACFTSRFAIKARGHVASREELAGRPAFPGGGPFLRATHLNRPGKPLQPLSTRYIRHGRQAARQLGDMVLFWRRRRRPLSIETLAKTMFSKVLSAPLLRRRRYLSSCCSQSAAGHPLLLLLLLLLLLSSESRWQATMQGSSFVCMYVAPRSLSGVENK